MVGRTYTQAEVDERDRRHGDELSMLVERLVENDRRLAILEERLAELDWRHGEELAERDRRHGEELAERDLRYGEELAERDRRHGEELAERDRRIEELNRRHSDEIAMLGERLAERDRRIDELEEERKMAIFLVEKAVEHFRDQNRYGCRVCQFLVDFLNHGRCAPSDVDMPVQVADEHDGQGCSEGPGVQALGGIPALPWGRVDAPRCGRAGDAEEVVWHQGLQAARFGRICARSSAMRQFVSNLSLLVSTGLVAD